MARDRRLHSRAILLAVDHTLHSFKLGDRVAGPSHPNLKKLHGLVEAASVRLEVGHKERNNAVAILRETTLSHLLIVEHTTCVEELTPLFVRILGEIREAF